MSVSKKFASDAPNDISDLQECAAASSINDMEFLAIALAASDQIERATEEFPEARATRSTRSKELVDVP